eukprot:6209618-Prymnesium_polylepis.1
MALATFSPLLFAFQLPSPVAPLTAPRASVPRASADECVVFSTLAQRRSVAKYDTSRAVPDSVVQAALESAILAPNHFLTEPW